MEKVEYVIDANAKPFKKGVEGAEKSVKGFEDVAAKSTAKIGEAFKGLGVAMAGAFAVDAIADGLGSLVSLPGQLAESNREAEIFAKQIGVGTQEAKGLGFAMEQVGLSGDQFADISKDIKDKVGEFKTAGTGAFQDVADVIGLNESKAKEYANSLQGLSGVDAIQKMVSDMEAAGASTEQMTFALESMGSDLSLATDLFKNNGAELKSLTSDYDKFSFALDKTDTKKLKQFDKALNLAGVAVQGITDRVAVALLPAFQGVLNIGFEVFEFFQNNFAAIKNVFAPITAAVQPIIDKFKKLFSTAEEGGGVIAILQKAFNGLGFALEFLSPVFELAADSFITVFNIIGDLVGAVVGLGEKFPILGDIIKGAAAGIVGIFVGLRTAAVTQLKGIAGIVTGILTGDLDKIEEGFKNALTAPFQGLNKGMEAAKKSFSTETKDFFGAGNEIKVKPVIDDPTTGGFTGSASLGTTGGTTAATATARTTEGASVSGSGRPQNIVLNIENVIKEFTISTTNIQESTNQAKQMVANALLTAVNDVNNFA